MTRPGSEDSGCRCNLECHLYPVEKRETGYLVLELLPKHLVAKGPAYSSPKLPFRKGVTNQSLSQTSGCQTCDLHVA